MPFDTLSAFDGTVNGNVRVDSSHNGICQRHKIARRYYFAGFSNNHSSISDIRHDTRRAASHRLSHDIRKGLAPARQHVQVKRIHDFGDVVARSKHRHDPGEPQGADRLPETFIGLFDSRNR